MTASRRPYRREPQAIRRDALIAATLALIAEGGLKAATVRAIAARAGVTPGLIRHYFASTDALIQAAYRSLTSSMISVNHKALAADTGDPAEQLARCIDAWLRPPVTDPQTLLVWAAFLPHIRADAGFRDEQVPSARGFGELVAAMVAALPADPPGRGRRDAAAACNAVINGLWLEGSTRPEAWAEGELQRIGLDACGAILGLDLRRHLSES